MLIANAGQADVALVRCAHALLPTLLSVIAYKLPVCAANNMLETQIIKCAARMTKHLCDSVDAARRQRPRSGDWDRAGFRQTGSD